ncbi:SUMF1/EgtB/PvdO family nonheme iron enzyme [Flavilitoribacter nigricans]|uniref:TIR domain-containing protein n=1 Tax=Flavilitoribacter nigricans (strain ATCC 23147 / DSM 23189 / NBRC 102662 / NCIMB 1420 / SS-2) TaxID=1122177 RepID=A0A2D0MZ14_FLAN2|nr:SUMF1/EgtB/PvdO family nonheme iron enzyme [Flavilitoribacter nigricans]PHN00703.1 hypothetical protein CRP01_40840 [Flavilitoribacter nigricans DSM 23189 = NBRC 102662]
MKHPNPAIFLNYRRALSTLEARLLYLMLQFRFPGQVFIDEETLEAGDRWRTEIKNCVRNARVMISLIPEDWISYAGELVVQSKLRYDPNCHVRHEIETALKNGITIIPVLINGAKQPEKAFLPESIAKLFDTFNNGIPLDFRGNPNVGAFEKFFEQVAKKAGLEQQAEESDSGLFPAPLAEEFPLPPDLAQLLPAAESPFVGLRPFHLDDARLFFGRSREIYHLCFKVVRKKGHRIFLLDGYSGTGKSSLLQAGLIPRVQAQGWYVSYRRREEDPIHGLSGVFQQLLADALEQPHADKLLILDQMEEAITDRIKGLPTELEDLAGALRKAILLYPDYRFILGFRSEQMVRITKALDDERLPYDDDNTLHQLDLVGATEAIGGISVDPVLAKKYQLAFSPVTLPQAIAQRLLKGWDNYHIAPLLQVNMELLWERSRQPDGTVVITRHALENIIDQQDGLLAHFIKKIRTVIPEGHADDQMLLQLLDEYVQDEPASAIRLDDELFRQEAFEQEAVFKDLHREFKKQYLLTEITLDGHRATRLSHDVLARVIRERYHTLTEAKLHETTVGYFDELKEKLRQQIYQLQYLEANTTLEQLLDLGIRRQELLPFLQELVFFWVETNFEEGAFAGGLIKKWLDSRLLSESLQAEGGGLVFPFDKKQVRQWLQRVDGNGYADLQKRYFAPRDTVMVPIAGGKLKIGVDEVSRLAEVSNFRLANVAVTWWKYGLFMYANDRRSELEQQYPNWGIHGDHPVVKVSWYDAVEYCNWLSDCQGLPKAYHIDKSVKDPNNTRKEDDRKWFVERVENTTGYRLPTEIEWEFTARGGLENKGFRYAGSDQLDEVGWYNQNTDGKTHPTGRKKPNELGLFDMSGNTWEWCWDWYESFPEKLPKDFSGAGRGKGRVLRGGSWDYFGVNCRVPVRNRNNPVLRKDVNGFRLAQDSL